MSVNSVGSDGGNGGSLWPVFSPDGTKVAFESRASDLGPTDTNGFEDVYVRDIVTGTTTLVSRNADGTDSGNGPSSTFHLRFSADGTKIAFTSRATNLGPHDSDPVGNDAEVDVYVHDLTTATTTMASVDATGLDSGNGAAENPVISPDGTKVAFLSQATNLGPTDTNVWPDVYIRDLRAGTTTLALPNAAGTGSGNGGSEWPEFSPDGSQLVLSSASTDLDPPAPSWGDVNVYLRDLATQTTSLVSVDATGTGLGGGGAPHFSPDGTKIVFSSSGGNLGPTDTNGTADLYVRDLATQTTSLVTVNGAGTDAGNGDSANQYLYPSFSPDSTKIAFESAASNLGPTDTNTCVLYEPRPPSPPQYHPCPDVYVRDLTTGTTTLVSRSADGTDAGNGISALPSFSPDGTKVVFESLASNLGPTDTNDDYDVYLRDLNNNTTSLVSAAAHGRDSGDYGSHGPAFSPRSTKIAFWSDATNLGVADTNGNRDVYLAAAKRHRSHRADS